VIPLGRGPNWPVVEVVTEQSIVLEPIAGKVTWSFTLVPIDGGATRLVTRVRFHVEPRVADRVMMAAIDPAAFMMTRRMLVGIKRRAEALAAMRDERPRRAEVRVAPNV